MWNNINVMGVLVSPQNVHIHPEAQNVTLFRNRILADVIKVRIKIRWKWTLNPMHVSLDRKAHTEVHGMKGYEDAGRDFPFSNTHQGASGATGIWECKEGRALPAARVQASQSWELWGNTFPLFKPPSL